jgi:hypothetical protein
MFKDYRRQIDEFWPYYVTQHRHPTSRQLHFIGNTNLLIWLFLAIARRNPFLLGFAVASSYVIAWIGHFFFERNIPATFRYPILAGVCDLIMYYKMWRGEMDAEVTKYASELTEAQ